MMGNYLREVRSHSALKSAAREGGGGVQGGGRVRGRGEGLSDTGNKLCLTTLCVFFLLFYVFFFGAPTMRFCGCVAHARQLQRHRHQRLVTAGGVSETASGG